MTCSQVGWVLTRPVFLGQVLIIGVTCIQKNPFWPHQHLGPIYQNFLAYTNVCVIMNTRKIKNRNLFKHILQYLEAYSCLLVAQNISSIKIRYIASEASLLQIARW